MGVFEKSKCFTSVVSVPQKAATKISQKTIKSILILPERLLKDGFELKIGATGAGGNGAGVKSFGPEN